MIEDKLLLWQFKCGSQDALRRIYEKYEEYLFTLATTLLNELSEAEDTVHDVFVSFAQSAESVKVNGNLRGYLSTCVVNRVRDKIRARQIRQTTTLETAASVSLDDLQPESLVIDNEEFHKVHRALAKIPDNQREVIMLHLQGEMKFRQIAKLQGVSINTVQGRYRYGLDKLRLLLGS